LEYETSKEKIASLKNEESEKENILAIENIINKFERTANSSEILIICITKRGEKKGGLPCHQ
jgi:hypothetical protein